MSDHEKQDAQNQIESASTPAGDQALLPQKRAPRLLPPWKVLLHNDDVNELHRVVEAVYQLTPLNREQSLARTQEAHSTGVSLLLITHKERAELYVEQFQSCGLVVTMEAAG
ncbi:MAG: hypothetical protein AMXMBFR13_09850 [Phycisphaerae bacterium]